MTEKNLAVIGAGYWGKNLVRNFHQLGVLKTICDPSSTSRQQMAKDYPDTTVTDDFNALISDPDIQAVVISAPAARHHALATASGNTPSAEENEIIVITAMVKGV